jgi:hypothetical protein
VPTLVAVIPGPSVTPAPSVIPAIVMLRATYSH